MTQYPQYEAVRRIGILGTGTIGASWAAYFLAQGYEVSAWDPGAGWQERLIAFIDNVWPQLEIVGLAPGVRRAAVMFRDDPGEAVAGCDFVQENAPEQVDVKRKLYQQIDPVLPDGAVLASSTSGLIMSDLQEGLATAGRFVVGHPFNPPHLIPLVEVVAGKDTEPAAADWSIGFYRHIGKHPIRVRKELPGHLANRLQAALWREAVLAARDGLASIEDIDAAVAQGPGLRWALAGPHMVMNLAGGKAGFRGMMDHFAPGIQGWWETMIDNPDLSGDLVETIAEGLADEMGGRSIADLEAERDRRLVRLLRLLKEAAH